MKIQKRLTKSPIKVQKTQAARRPRTRQAAQVRLAFKKVASNSWLVPDVMSSRQFYTPHFIH